MDFELTSEQQMFRDQVVRFCQEKIAPFAEEADLKAEFSYEAWKAMGEFGLLGLHLPEEYGGQDADVMTSIIANEAMGYGGADGGTLLAFGAHTYLCADTIFKNGTEEQRKKYLPKLISGDWIGAMGLTEPDAGSDVASMKTTAVKKGDKYILNGAKMFITNGPIADVLVVYASTDKSAKHFGISGFIIEKDFPGFSVGKELHKMGVRASTTGELIFEDCEVPEENLLGQAGAGFLMALGTLEWDRSALLAPFVGGMEKILEDCCKYALNREQFGRPIAKFEAIQAKLAEMKTFHEIARLMVYRIGWCKDQGRPLNHLEASLAKLFIGEQGNRFADHAVQIHGGYGYIHEYPVERFFRDARLAAIGGGTSEIQRMVIARLMKEEMGR